MMPYIINVALILTGCLAFYKILLRRETFYRVNRFTLIICLFIAFALPLVPVPQQWSIRKAQEETVSIEKQKTPAATPISVIPKHTQPVTQSPVENAPGIEPIQSHAGIVTDVTISFRQLMNWTIWVYWFGVILFGISFLFQLVLLLWRSYRNPAIIDGKFRIVEVCGDKAPCSFGNTIFINPEKYDWETYDQIIQHEKVHIRERHTLDIILAELALIFQWFNPFAWIYRREIENNLEFMTDDRLMEEKIDKTSYQLNLLKVTAPHLPLRLTTNYNQSTLKKRIAMMNSKRSSLHTAWKYFFLIPVLALLACLLNEPKAQKKETESKEKSGRSNSENQGYWFARIEKDDVYFSFSDEEIKNDEFKHHGSHSGTNFKLSELSSVPKETIGTFSITREAGKMEFTGKFEGNIGMGKYKFTPDASYFSFIKSETKNDDDDDDEDDEIAFFFLNVKKAHVTMLKSQGFKEISSDDLIATTALGVNAAFVKEMKDAGLKELDLENLVALKAMSITPGYVKEIRDAGYKKADAEQLIGLKAQGIDKEYIDKMKKAKGIENKELDEDDLDDMISYKAMDISEEFVKSFKNLGLKGLDDEDLVSLKAMGVTPEYIKSWQALGFDDLDADDYVSMKAQDVTPEFMKKMKDMGFEEIDVDDMVSFKALGITPEYIKSFENAGIKNIDKDDYAGLKALGITPEYLKSFDEAGFKNISIDDAMGAKAMGVTPEYIKSMRAKGLNYDKLEKYIRLKSID